MDERRAGLVRFLLIGVVVSGLLANASTTGASPPGTGDQAPDFELPGSDGSTHRLSDFRGKQVVVLAWFPKAFTGG